MAFQARLPGLTVAMSPPPPPPPTEGLPDTYLSPRATASDRHLTTSAALRGAVVEFPPPPLGCSHPKNRTNRDSETSISSYSPTRHLVLIMRFANSMSPRPSAPPGLFTRNLVIQLFSM